MDDHKTSFQENEAPKQQQIIRLGTDTLTPWSGNARKHSKKQVKQIATSIKEFGFTNPVLIDEDQTVLAGHGRLEAAKLLGLEVVPCLYIEHMSVAQKRAYVVADNQLALNASWDEDILGQELKALSELDLEFDMELTGFSISEIDSFIEAEGPEDAGDPRGDTLPRQVEARCKPGDVWALGKHRLICGNALVTEVISQLMAGQTARMIFTDPPYNVPIDGHVGGKGKIKHREFAFASGEMSVDEFTSFLHQAFKNLIDHSTDGSIHYICMDWRHMSEMLGAGQGIYAELKNLIVWVKDQGGMGTFYRSRHELIFVFKHGTGIHVNSFELGQHGRYRTNVWEYRGANVEELQLHPTVKPVEMIADAIRDVTARGDLVLDIFGGSGSTLIAAEKTGRRAYLCELDPAYCDLILARFEDYGKEEVARLSAEDAAPIKDKAL